MHFYVRLYVVRPCRNRRLNPSFSLNRSSPTKVHDMQSSSALNSMEYRVFLISCDIWRKISHYEFDLNPTYIAWNRLDIFRLVEMLKSNKYTQKMKSLEPDVEEQALLAGISMFSPFLRNVRDHDDIHLLSKIQVSKSKIDLGSKWSFLWGWTEWSKWLKVNGHLSLRF